jgi:hypothetical protein
MCSRTQGLEPKHDDDSSILNILEERTSLLNLSYIRNNNEFVKRKTCIAHATLLAGLLVYFLVALFFPSMLFALSQLGSHLHLDHAWMFFAGKIATVWSPSLAKL